MKSKASTPKSISLKASLIPVVLLVVLLAYNVFVFGDDALSGSNQFILLIGGAIAAVVGFYHKVSYEKMLAEVAENLKSTTGALLILLMVGALSGTWLVSGIIPAMIYYGLQILNPTIFLAACVIICAIISIATGSSWTTSATVGIALIGIGNALGIPMGMTAGAVLSGAYFGDKMSPLSDTTNLAPAMAGGDLFTHIRYMLLTTVPTLIVTLIVFVVLGFTMDTSGEADTASILNSIDATFNISGWLFLVPLGVILMILKKTPPLMALLIGTLLGGVFALIFQPEIIAGLSGAKELNFENGYKGILNAITVSTEIATDNVALNDLFTSKGMSGMLGTIWLIMCAMVFGGIMDGIGALSKISETLLGMAKTTFGLFASTVASCLALNVTASDQYLAIVIPGKMFSKAYKDKGLAPENLSRTLEDSGTVTSVLIPWNTCGAYHSGVLGVGVADYFVYAIFNWLSPFMTLLFAAFQIKIAQLKKD
ncbi:Na+/H+ antiporter NhaC [Flavobacteria bacterium MS024-3C]|jgi:NhaC family Na+:H+ antiporter|nr:Na+/H+ antiporter NhaC [Flavobacteria bacterium MS024-3C]KRP14033.1 MAG: sodium:proton antiporter [Polaribacter sp. BACL8 MAG-120419-bin8]MBT4839256.1 Na+/H+ antiporter NhaC [Flavobacteriaceae bacterium]MBT5921674.1 Na+/H+ antiporter NhaC [Flavobacteriaceae bacterium]MCO4854198.1 Na+/H+ antiporter NhaC [Flavobacteriaceae bacterium]|tara:strand:- start:9250 stop:10698 length:1449 start_codon:yes stop_codon:yes gene_type:complete